MNIKTQNKPIFLEGPDGSGKTTLGGHIKDHLGWLYSHSGGPTPTYEDYVQRVKEQHKMIDDHKGAVIIDRCCQISARAYLNVGEPSYNPQGWESLIALDPILIFCTYQGDHSPEAKDRYLKSQMGKGHKTMEYAVETWNGAAEVVSKYRELALTCRAQDLTVITYDFEVNNLHDLLVRLEGLV